VVFCDILFILVLGVGMVEFDIDVYERMGLGFWGKAPVVFFIHFVNIGGWVLY